MFLILEYKREISAVALDKEQKKELATLRKLYSSNNWIEINQAISQIMVNDHI